MTDDTSAPGTGTGSGDAQAAARLRRLSAAGVDLGELNDEQLAVLADLDDAEIDTLLDVRLQLLDHGPAVEAHAAGPMTIGGLFF